MELTLLQVLLGVLLPLAYAQCKCTPDRPCWPAPKEWGRFNSSVNGRLIRSVPPAAPCYGPARDASACEAVTKDWTSSTFHASQPIGYDYPLNAACPPAPFSANAPLANCTIGNSPVYAVDVAEEGDISTAIHFAKDNNLRLVIKSTGHDFLQRSTGFGSLSIWLQNYRKGFTFYDDFQTVNSCSKSDWQGGALTIAGAYAWSDIYPAAFERNLIIVGGNNRGPSSTGGWVQGGGHSPVTRYHGLGADQVLSARVVLASGEVVTASPCENPDVFYAIRGGGGGTYGVVTQMTVKTYPTTNVNVINVDVGASSASPNMTSRFLDAMTDIYASYPYLSQAGFGGYGAWVADSPIPIGGNNFTTLFQQSFTTFGKDAADTTRLFQPVADMIARLQDSGFAVVISQKSFVDYGAYYANKSGTDAAVGSASALASRLLGREVLGGNWTRLRAAMETMAGPNGAVFHTIVHHGLETSPETRDNSSAVQPGWYNSVILDIFERPMLDGLSVAANIDLFDDIRQNILPAYRALSPTTGTYMNEADWGEERFAEDFYSTNYKKLLEIKTKYDPLGVFYCPTCVGSDEWSEDAGGALCRR